MVKSSGWWFGTGLLFVHFIYGMSSETHWRIPSFFKMVQTTNQRLYKNRWEIIIYGFSNGPPMDSLWVWREKKFFFFQNCYGKLAIYRFYFSMKNMKTSIYPWDFPWIFHAPVVKHDILGFVAMALACQKRLSRRHAEPNALGVMVSVISITPSRHGIHDTHDILIIYKLWSFMVIITNTKYDHKMGATNHPLVIWRSHGKYHG